MHLRHLILLASLCAATALPAADVPADTAVRRGTLPNGLTYFVRHNNYPEHHADFFLAQRVGSIQEEESQRGLAHFLEHMCFNGTKHFPGNSLISYMESIGVKFGANLNAYTSTDQTVYNISNVPTARRSALDSCFLALSDWSHALLLRGRDIDEERGVIEGEWRQRTSASNRMLERALPTLYPGSRYGQRMPIGTMDVVRNFKHRQLRDYYKKWYHPANQCVIVVGDIDPDYAVAKIQELFGSVKSPKHPAPVVQETVPDNADIIAAIQTDPEQPSTSVRLLFKHDDLNAGADGEQWMRNDYLNYAVASMLGGRFADLALQPQAPFTHVGVADRNYFLSRTRQALQLTALSKSGQAASTMQWMAREVKRATEHGFTEAEMLRMQNTYEAALDKLYRERDRYANTRYARDYVRAWLEGEPIPGIEENCAIMRRMVSQVTLDEVNAHLRRIVSPTDRNVVLVAFAPHKAGENPPAEQTLIDAFHAGRAEPVEAYLDTLHITRLELPDLCAGTIVAEKALTEFDATEWTLSNGIHVQAKHTEIVPGEVVIAGAGPGGLSQNYRPQDAPSLKAFGQLAATLAFGGLTANDLKKFLAGKQATMRTFVSKTEEGFQGAATRRDLELAFQLLYLRLTAPQKDERAYAAWLESQRSSLDNRAADPKFEFADSIFAGVYDHHPLAGERLGKDEIEHTNIDRVLEIYRDRFADMSDFTVYLVGDFDTDSLRLLTERYLASLPGGGRREQPRDIGYRVLSGEVDRAWSRTMQNPQDKVYYFWTGACDYNLRNALLAQVTSQVFKEIFRDEIREKRGWTYHVDTHCSISADYNGTDHPVVFMPLNVTVTAGKAQETRQVIEQAVAQVATAGITHGQLDKARQYLRKVHHESLDDNTYWMDIMRRHTKWGINFDRDYLATLEAITPDDVRRFVAEYLGTGGRLRLTMTGIGQ
ncbi:MAG: insulinase family protein [Muribaculaceae bacterium]|nr:insulinase family protein [Muribaculaceae bacterium]